MHHAASKLMTALGETATIKVASHSNILSAFVASSPSNGSSLRNIIIPQNTGWRRKWYSHTLFGLSPNDRSHSNMHTLSNSTILGGVDIAAYTYLKLTALTESEFNLVELNILKRISHRVCSSDCECCPALCGDGAESFHGNKSSTSYLSDRQRQKEF